jgi:stalled ribosome alternative rescue factor ArfA
VVYSHHQNDFRCHVEKGKPGDYYYACYSSDAEGISRKYFENLGKEMIGEIGLDSFEGMHAAAQF